MTKKRVYWDHNPGLRLLRELTRGYYLSPFQGWGSETDFSTEHIEHRTLESKRGIDSALR
jgi:hypothetical protein